MKNKYTLLSAAALSLGLLMAGGAAQATVFNFGQTAIGNEGGNPGETDSAPIGLRFDGSGSVFTDGFTGSGLQVIATGQTTGQLDNSSGYDGSPYAYLDDTFEDRTAGLGVCKILSGDECNPAGDDNITGADPDNGNNEQLTLTSNKDVTWSGFLFKGELHGAIDDGRTLLVNGVATTFGEAKDLTTGLGNSFTFGYGGDQPTQFYLDSAAATVPAPAGLGLFGLALVGLGTIVRRRQLKD